VLAVVSCADGTGPPVAPSNQHGLGSISGPGVAAAALQPIRHAARMGTPDGEPLFHNVSFSSSSAGGPELDTYGLSFWAVYGRETEADIRYASQGQEDGSFLSFKLGAFGLHKRPDGTPIAFGDSVRITISVDPSQLLVRFQPAGLVFNPLAPAQLEMWYGAAGGDLDGDGDADQDDVAIRDNRLGMWYQQDEQYLWYPIVSLHDANQAWFKTHLFHFSGYVVSWDK
jgi:hypothetical protein